MLLQRKSDTPAASAGRYQTGPKGGGNDGKSSNNSSSSSLNSKSRSASNIGSSSGRPKAPARELWRARPRNTESVADENRKQQQQQPDTSAAVQATAAVYKAKSQTKGRSSLCLSPYMSPPLLVPYTSPFPSPFCFCAFLPQFLRTSFSVRLCAIFCMPFSLYLFLFSHSVFLRTLLFPRVSVHLSPCLGFSFCVSLNLHVSLTVPLRLLVSPSTSFSVSFGRHACPSLLSIPAGSPLSFSASLLFFAPALSVCLSLCADNLYS